MYTLATVLGTAVHLHLIQFILSPQVLIKKGISSHVSVFMATGSPMSANTT